MLGCLDGALACSVGLSVRLGSRATWHQLERVGSGPAWGDPQAWALWTLGWCNLVSLVVVFEATGCLRFPLFPRATPRPRVPNWTDPSLATL